MNTRTPQDPTTAISRLGEYVDASQIHVEESPDADRSSLRHCLRVLPTSEQDITHIFHALQDLGWTVIPTGGGSGLIYGNVQDVDAVLLLDTSKLTQVIHYSPADMLITVEAGMSLRQLQGILAEEGQMLPLDPICDSETMTVGALIATAQFGPYRAHYGTLRDMVTALRVVLGNGTAIKMGSRVVKNVAGYDLAKVFVGSLGTLGVITECTLKVKPIPSYREVCVIQGSLDEALAWQHQVMDSPYAAACFELVSALPAYSGTSYSSYGSWALLIGNDDNESGAISQREYLRQMAEETLTVVDPSSYQTFWNAYRDHLLSFSIVIRVQTAPNAAGRHAAEIRDRLSACDQVSAYLSVTVPHGICRVYLISEDTQAARKALGDVMDYARNHKLAFVVEKAPTAIRRGVDVFYSPRLQEGSLDVMRLLKDQYDPQHILNPGIFVGGI